MGPPLKASSKKAWRKNIDASEVENFLQEASHQARRGPAVETLEDADLFFVDKGTDKATPAQEAVARRRKPRDTKLHLRSQAILQQAHRAQPAVPPRPATRKVNHVVKKAEKGDKPRRPKFCAIAAAELDIWGNAPLASGVGEEQAEGAAGPGPGTERQQAAAAGAAGARHRKAKLRPRGVQPTQIRAVEVDMAGCSYNPEPEAHQDALAVLVGAEMKKLLHKELEPVAPPKRVDVDPAELEMDEVTRLQVEVAPDDEDENEIHLSDEEGNDGGDGTMRAGRASTERKTRKDRNRSRRRLSQEKEQVERQALKRQRRELEQLSTLEQELEETRQQQELKRMRRQVVKEEKAATLPPRLGKHKFEPPSVQVATSDELSGSLRRVKSCPMVTAHRYKSLQHRGLIEPRKVIVARKGKRISYEKGLRTEKALAGQAEIEGLKKQRQQVAKAAKKEKAAAKKQQLAAFD